MIAALASTRRMIFKLKIISSFYQQAPVSNLKAGQFGPM
jgi:hypothetical protein